MIKGGTCTSCPLVALQTLQDAALPAALCSCHNLSLSLVSASSHSECAGGQTLMIYLRKLNTRDGYKRCLVIMMLHYAVKSIEMNEFRGDSR